MESLLLFRRALSSPTMCRFIPALSVPSTPGFAEVGVTMICRRALRRQFESFSKTFSADCPGSVIISIQQGVYTGIRLNYIRRHSWQPMADK